jgi:GMP synthase (glutamine-hydrolysing)
VLFPVSFNQPGFRSIGIRTLITNDFMTGRAAVPGEDIPKQAVQEMVEQILDEVPDIARVVYDLSSKPPSTTEWE